MVGSSLTFFWGLLLLIPSHSTRFIYRHSPGRKLGWQLATAHPSNDLGQVLVNINGDDKGQDVGVFGKRNLGELYVLH